MEDKQLLVRTAQTKFNKKGFPKDLGYSYSQKIVEDVLANIVSYQDAYGITDMIDLVEAVANDVVEQM